MNYKIENGNVFSTINLHLERGESFCSEPGAMVSMSSSIRLEAMTTGKGIFGPIKAAIGGESMFGTIFFADKDAGEVVLAPSAPGDIVQMELSGQTIFAQSGAYLAGSPELVLSSQGSLKALLSGEGLFLLKITGKGALFLNSYGAIYTKTLAEGEKYIVDTGHILAFESTVSYNIIKAAKGIFSSLASGEGLVCEFSGPGKIWIQTRNLQAFAKTLVPFLPNK